MSRIVPLKVKGAYSDICMKVHVVLKITLYLTNIYEMRFLMKHSLNIYTAMPKWSFDKTFWATWYPNQYYGSPQTIGDPLIV